MQHTIHQRWKQTALHNKLLVLIGGLTLIGAIVALILSEMHRREDRRPVIINSRPPELLQPFTCDPKDGFHSGNIQTFAKNLGNIGADNVFPVFALKIIPEKKSGNPIFDELPPANCNLTITDSSIEFSVPINIEMRPQIRQSAGTLPPVTSSEPVQLYASSCFYYRDPYNNRHAVCDLYRLDLPSTNSLDKINGSPTFMCDGTPKIGKFTKIFSGGHCGN